MRDFPRFLVLAFLLAGFVFVGCSKQETPTETTATPKYTPPAPPATATGNKDCAATGSGNDTCKLTTDQVAAEAGMAGHDCESFVADSAIHITKGAVTSGRFKKIHIKKENSSGKDFTIAVAPCPGSSGNPFPHAKKPDKDNWDSGDFDPSVADNAHFHLVMTEKSAKGTKQSDPHIVIDGTGMGGNNR